MRYILIPLSILLICLPASAQDDSGMLSRISASVWCPILDSGTDEPSGEIIDTDEDGIPDTFVENADLEPTLECDIGLGVYLAGKKFDQGTLGLVGGLGSKSVVIGIGWIFDGQEDNPLSVAVGAGLGAPYDTKGIYVDKAGLVIGSNLSLSESQLRNVANYARNRIGSWLQTRQ